MVDADSSPQAVTVNSIANKIYVANTGGATVMVIDGATNATSLVTVGVPPYAMAVNPVTGRVYVANEGGGTVTVIAEAPVNDVEVRAAFDRLPGDTTTLARPALTGKGVNRSTPGRTTMMGVGNRVNTSQVEWDWATVDSGAGTDSITWTYNWGTDSLISGENFVCCVPFEDQAGTSNNLGLGSPFAGNLEVYPVYRIVSFEGIVEMTKSEVRMAKLPTIVRGVLFLGDDRRPGTGDRAVLLDIAGRKVVDLTPGANDVSRLAPGVYFVRERLAVGGERNAVHKVVLTR